MQVHCQNAVNTGLDNQVGHQFGGNRRAGLGAAVLTGIAEIGHHCGDPCSRGSAQRVSDDQQFHQVVIGGVRCGLDNKHILAAHILVNLDKDFLVIEFFDPRIQQADIHSAVHRGVSGDLFCQGPVGIAGNQHGFGCDRHNSGPPVCIAM